MLSQPQVGFLQGKIMEIRQALFYTCSDSLIKLPVSVVNALHVDSLGQVWFLVSRPSQHISEFDQNFAARLEFYKKGCPFYLRVKGRANIVADPEELNHIPEEVKKYTSDNTVVLNMNTAEIFYYPYPEEKPVPAAKEPSRIYSGSSRNSGFFKTLQYIVKDIIPVFQSH